MAFGFGQKYIAIAEPMAKPDRFFPQDLNEESLTLIEHSLNIESEEGVLTISMFQTSVLILNSRNSTLHSKTNFGRVMVFIGSKIAFIANSIVLKGRQIVDMENGMEDQECEMVYIVTDIEDMDSGLVGIEK